MLKELRTVEIIAEFLRQNGTLKTPKNIGDIYDFFRYLNTNRQNFNTLYIFNYLYNFISSEAVAKRNTSARVFEDLLGTLFGGVVSDTAKRKNLQYEVSDYFTNAKDKIASNRREKADIIFGDYKISIKTLMKENTEINMGSFERSVLFDGLNVNDYLTERKSTKGGAGLGSKPQLLKTFSLIETLSSWAKWREKFNKMAEFIFADDFIIAVKNDIIFELYFISGAEFCAILREFSADKNEILKILNRYEGNSIRIDRTLLFEKCEKKITLDFSYLNATIIAKINAFDDILHENYAKYFNLNDKTKAKSEIFSHLELLFGEFERFLEAK